MSGIDTTVFTTVYQIIGLPAALLLIYWLAQSWMKNQNEKTDADRAEHVNKWNSMVQAFERESERQITAHADKIGGMVKAFENESERQLAAHADETKRIFALYERQLSIAEMQAAKLSQLNDSVGEIRNDVGVMKDRLEDHITKTESR